MYTSFSRRWQARVERSIRLSQMREPKPLVIEERVAAAMPARRSLNMAAHKLDPKR